MSVSMRMDEPVVIAQGGAWEEHGWGPYQFPTMVSRLNDGRIAISYAGPAAEDSVYAYGRPKANPVAVSADGGKTWEHTQDPRIYAQMGDPLPSGDRISVVSIPPVACDDDRLPPCKNRELYRSFPEHVYRMDDFAAPLFQKSWPFSRLKAGETETVREYVPVEWPNMFVNKVYYDRERPGVLPPFAINGHTRVAPDGTIWRTVEERGNLDPVTGGYNPFYAVFYFQSTDNAKSFHYVSWLPFIPDTRENKNAYFFEGFNEADVCFVPDGSVITLLRSNGVGPSYIARSVDNGRSWSAPRKFDVLGVWPNLCALGCGVTVASYGRPGFFIRATNDPSGMAWDDPVNIVPMEFGNLESTTHYFGSIGEQEVSRISGKPTTCAYSSIYPIDGSSFLVFYSDFTYPNAAGVACKTILVRRVAVQ